ncbi:colanic acid biosynthesis acetyltransferase WcaF [Polaribacter haliotis]|uniref:Colanic acid biosynthesis acetyltransferase WcaF n=1 Tax=Polaribacter haliotis TaxID=1888915 RepID=A0A7L8ACF9_9FLAO|nr:putative colanic acid biosynthesis acetyltransferase [Polaribacter haliotis]QOD59672.1 colanic acid biosynthesis acetyltransferase WcaF [Polaribacter haliotis]
MQIQELNKFELPNNFRGKNAFIVQLWWLVQAIFFRTSPQFLYGYRRFLLRLFGAKIGKKVIIRPSVKITYPWKVSIGDYSWIGDDVVLYSLGEIEIGKNVVVSQKSYLCTGSHDYLSSNFPIYAKKIILEEQVWLATDVYIAPGVSIGKGSVIGARSSVYKNIPKGWICYGNPAKPIKKRIEKEHNNNRS